MSGPSYQEWRPPDGLARHVACTWAGRMGSDGETYVRRVLPDGCVDIVWNGVRLIVAGPDTGPVDVEQRPDGFYVGVRFRPGLAPTVLGLPASEMLDLRLDGADVLGAERAGRLAERLAAASSLPAAAVELAEAVSGWLPQVAQDPDELVEATVAVLGRGSGAVGRPVAALPMPSVSASASFTVGAGRPSATGPRHSTGCCASAGSSPWRSRSRERDWPCWPPGPAMPTSPTSTGSAGGWRALRRWGWWRRSRRTSDSSKTAAPVPGEDFPMSTQIHDAGRGFIQREGRVLEQRLAATIFDGAPAAGVVDALRGYQNPDGGFGHGLEPDKRCPDSLAIDVESALHAMHAAGTVDHDMVGRACDFLASIATADGAVALASPVMEAYPRAAHWSEWTYEPGFNPTAGLTGLLHRLGVDHPWRTKATEWCWSALAGGLPDDAHAVSEILVFLGDVPDRDRADAHRAAGRRAPEPGQPLPGRPPRPCLRGHAAAHRPHAVEPVAVAVRRRPARGPSRPPRTGPARRRRAGPSPGSRRARPPRWSTGRS